MIMTGKLACMHVCYHVNHQMAELLCIIDITQRELLVALKIREKLNRSPYNLRSYKDFKVLQSIYYFTFVCLHSFACALM